jgi:DNA-binding winged helix-turn-helix (wHTH) protein
VRFGVFEADFEAGELRKHGMRLKLPQQAFRVLQVLIERPNE